uniref:Uncharacterized protein n=2 Tax=Gasterosteus aculeatus TaxID=69293 RepID=G3NE32_GASAC
MEKTRMIVLSVCLSFTLLGCTEALHVTPPCNSCTNGTVNGSNTTAPVPGHHSTHVTSSHSPAASNSTTTPTNATSQQPVRPPVATSPPGSVGTSWPSASPVLGPCSHLLVSATSVLICAALG